MPVGPPQCLTVQGEAEVRPGLLAPCARAHARQDPGALVADPVGPATVLVILVMSVNAVGDGLRDALDPTSGSGGRA